MKYLVFLIVYPILWCISLLPFRLLYLFSDFIYIIVYHFIGYRKKTVRENLALALPHLSDIERLKIEKKSFHHLCDTFVEMAKTLTISEKEMNKRFVYTNLDVYKNLESKQKSIAILVAHYASHEWLVSINRKTIFEGFAIYKKLSNPYFDKMVRDIRSKFKATLINTKEAVPKIEENYKNNILCAYGFASDQSPRVAVTLYWRKFMGIEVPVHVGPENLAKKFDMNMIFCKVTRPKRGYYRCEFEVLTENAKEVPNYQITDKYTELVEKQILEAPEFYMWTHKRWKHRRQ